MFATIVCVCVAAIAGCVGSPQKERKMTEAASRTKDEGHLRAGTARVEITPPVGIKMTGYAARKSGATGVHDPLFARIVVLRDDNVSIAFVSADVAIFCMDRVVAEAKKKWNLNHVVLSATHTHSGPNTREPSEWRTETEEKIIAAIGKAAEKLFPARMSWARDVLKSNYMPHNRRFVAPDGTVTMMWDNPKRIPTHPVDPRVSVLRIDDDAGKPRALLVHYACHAVVLGAQNVLISADYPGAMADRIEEELGPDCMGVFLQGAAGDIDPFEMNLGGEYGFRIVKEAGVSLAEGALGLAKRTTPLASENGALIKVKESAVTVAFREDEKKTEERGVMAVVIGDELALAIMGGEPFVGHQLDLDKKSPLDSTLLLGYSCFGVGTPEWRYLPTVEATRTGGYGADGGPINPLEPEAGEKLVDEAARCIKDLVGR